MSSFVEHVKCLFLYPAHGVALRAPMSIVAILIMLAALLIVIALIGIANAQFEFHFGFRIKDASDNGVNGL
jgi:hypothetical protein